MNTPHPAEHSPPRHRTRLVICALLLVLLPLVAYIPAYDAGFYSDDETHIVRNERLRTSQGLSEIWTDVRGTAGLYYPMTFTTYWVDYQLWGSNPGGYHTGNIILHALNVFLVWLVFRRLGIPGAWFAAAIFALHPVQVESVAWATERRNTLSSFFYFLSMLAYLGFRPLGSASRTRSGTPEPMKPHQHPGGRRSRPLYALSLVLFIAALLSKTFTLSLPAALLVVTWWKNGRLERRDWLPLVPFFVLGIGLSLWTAGLERTLIEQGGPGWGAYTSADRLLIAGRAVWFYLGKLLFPVDLSFVYPQWTIDAGAWGQYLYPVAVIVGVAAIYAARRRLGRAPVAGLLFFIGTLLPVLGFVDYFYMMMSFVADRFLYLPSLGIIALFAGYSADGLRRALPRARWVPPVAGVALLTALGLGTWQRSSCYENAETLYRDVLVKHPDSWAGHYSLGSVLAAAGRPDEALPHLETAARLKTNFPSIRGYLAVVYSQLGRHDEALRLFHQALDENPNDVEIRTNLGVALVNIGKYDDAIEQYGKVLEIEPGYTPALRNLTRIVLYRMEALSNEGEASRVTEFALRTRALSLSVGAHDLAAEIDRRLRTRPAPAE